MTRASYLGNRGAHRILVLVCLGIAALVSVGPATSASTVALGRSSAASGPSTASEGGYAVTFEESGLAPGTNWSVTMNGSTENGTAVTLTFFEPNGSYPFFPGAVPGYSTNPEGNVTVDGGPANVTVPYVSNTSVSPSCSTFSWTGNNYTFQGTCTGSFETDYRAFNATSGYSFDNSTFALGAITEVSSSGAIDALATPGYQGYGEVTVQPSPMEVNVTDVIVGNVTTAVGLNANSGQPDGQVPAWTPEDASGANGTVWGNGPHVLGRATITVVFHFAGVGASAPNRVKFDVMVSGWPWVNSDDQLGAEIAASAEFGTYFVYVPASDTLIERWSSNSTVAASIVFGPTANATGPGSELLQVSDDLGLYPSGPAPDVAFALLTFEGPGGYANLTYDPWIVFGAVGAEIILPPASPATGATLPLVAVGIIAGAAATLGAVSYRVRRRGVDEGLMPRSPTGDAVPARARGESP